MKSISRIVAVAAACWAGMAAADASDVNQLTSKDFKSFATKHDLLLAEFYAPWCGHCKALAPEYEVAAAKLKEKDIPLVKVDCTEEAGLCESYGIEGYPTLKVFRGLENVTPYTGARKADAIVSYMTKQSLPAVSTVDASRLEGFKSADKVVIVGFFGADDKVSNATFQKLADSLRDTYLFGATSDENLAKQEGVKTPGVVLYKSFDEGKAVFDSSFGLSDVSDFIKNAAQPILGEIGPDTYSGYMESGLPLAYIFTESKAKDALVKTLSPIAKAFKGKINFATIDAATFGQHAANLNLQQTWPAFAIQDTKTQKKFPFDQAKEITADSIKGFVEDFVAGKIEPSIKSEPIPATQEGPVVTVVANEYNNIVLDSDKDVLLEFYAPWCGHCKALAPKFEELADLYWKVPALKSKVTIAKVDGTLNDVPDTIQGFPTIKLFPAGRKGDPVEYSGDRSIESFVNFIKEHGTHKIDAYNAPGVDEPASPLGQAAPAATKIAKGASGAAEKIKEAAGAAGERVKQAVFGADDLDDDMDHDEL